MCGQDCDGAIWCKAPIGTRSYRDSAAIASPRTSADRSNRRHPEGQPEYGSHRDPRRRPLIFTARVETAVVVADHADPVDGQQSAVEDLERLVRCDRDSGYATPYAR